MTIIMQGLFIKTYQTCYKTCQLLITFLPCSSFLAVHYSLSHNCCPPDTDKILRIQMMTLDKTDKSKVHRDRGFTGIVNGNISVLSHRGRHICHTCLIA